MSPPSLHTSDLAKELHIFQCQTRTACTSVSHTPSQDGESTAAAGRDPPTPLNGTFTTFIPAEPALISSGEV